jgi:inosose dehydratase
MKIGNAPVSWGVYAVNPDRPGPPWQRVLDEIAATGYVGTELGPWGYLPMDADRLAEELARRGLELASTFHPLQPDREPATELRRADEVCAVLARLGCKALVLACEGTAARDRVAGRAAPGDSLSGAAWTRFVDLVRRAAAQARDRGLQVFFHHHAGTFIETPAEVSRLLDAIEPEVLGLCLDTGHYAFAGGSPMDAIARYGERIGYLHLKDLRRARLTELLGLHASFLDAVRANVFCELGTGEADLASVVASLVARDYQGWCIVEQDRIVDAATPADMPRRSAEISRAWLRTALNR